MSEDSARKTRKPVQKRSQEKRQNILQAGGKLFAQKGFNGTNSKEIARTAGVSIGSFYSYFPDKGSVFLEITQVFYEKVFSVTQERMKGLDPSMDRRQVITALVHSLYEAHDFEPELHREISLMILAGSNPSSPREEYQELCRKVSRRVEEMDRMVEAWLTGVLKAWGLPGDDRKISTVAALVFRISEETVHRLRQFPHSMAEPERVLGELIHMLDLYLADLV